MDFIEATIYTTTEGIDLVIDALTPLNVGGFVIEDAADFNAFLEDTTPHWDYVDEDLMRLKDAPTNIKIYLSDNEYGRTIFQSVAAKLAAMRADDPEQKLGSLTIETTNVREEDWANNWKQYFKPFEVGSRFVVKPSWEEYNQDTSRMILEIDPASSFGTGTHETTKLCMESLEKSVFQDAEVLDMGCGSGILAVAALMLGAKHVNYVDIDDNAVRTAKENLDKNIANDAMYEGFSGNVLTNAKLADQICSTKYDVIAANIVADVLIAMRPIFLRALKPGATIITSGIIGDRADEVYESFVEAGFRPVERRQKNDWVTISFTV